MVRHAVGKGREAAWADTFKALGDRTRLSILLRLLQGEQCVTGLAKALELSTPRISFHLSRMKYASLLVNERRGQEVYYQVSPALIKKSPEGPILDLDGCLIKFS